MKKDNIKIRPIKKLDLKHLNDWKNNKNIYKFLGGGFMPVSIDIQEHWLENLIDTTSNNKRFIIERVDNNKPIGLIGLYNINWIHRTAEIGLFIGDETEQGNGYAKIAYEIIETFAKKDLNLRKMKLFVVYNNNKALSLWKKVGFTEIGKLSKERYIDGKYLDLVIMDKFLI